jgi:hypothetical protein
MIEWLRAPFRRRFPYERYNTWSQDLEQKRRWTEALEATGVEAVQIALARSRGGPRASISIGEVSMTQGFAEEWLNWRESHKINWTKWGFFLAMVVALAGLIRWLFGW